MRRRIRTRPTLRPSIGLAKKVTLGVAASAASGIAALVFATAAAANLPHIPRCSDVGYPMIESAFSFTPTGTQVTVTTTKTKTKTDSPGLNCLYYAFEAPRPNGSFPPCEPCIGGKPVGGVNIEFDYPASKSLFEERFAGAHKGFPSVKRVSGIGDAAFIGTDGKGAVFVFLDGTYIVAIKANATYYPKSGGTEGPGAGLTQAIEAFAKAIIPLT